MKELKLNDIIITNSSEPFSAFNTHFSTIGPRVANEIPPIANDDLSYITYISVKNNRFNFYPSSTSIVFSHLSKLSQSKATGVDNISAKIIRECADLTSVS